MSRTVLIAGCGDVGTALGRSLHDGGIIPFGLRRNIERLPAYIRPIAIDLTAPFDLENLPNSLWGVVFLPSSQREPGLYRRVRIDGFAHLRQALLTSGCEVRRWIYVSSTSVYGQDSGECVDEDVPPVPASDTAKILREGESQLETMSLPGTVVRFAGIYGPGRTMYLRKVARGDACRQGLWTNRIHVDDCAAMLHHLLALETVDSCYIGVDDEPARQCELMQWLAGRLGKQCRQDKHDAADSGKRLSNRRIVQSGFKFRFPSYREGYAEMIKTFLENE